MKTKNTFNKDDVIKHLMLSKTVIECCRKFYKTDNDRNTAKRLIRYCKNKHINYTEYLKKENNNVVKNTTCLFCGKPFKENRRQKKYCNHSCARKHYIKLHKDKFRIINSGKRFCINCGKEIEQVYTSKQNKFCSIKCSSEFRKKETVNKWRDCKSEHKHQWKIPNAVREYLFEKVGFKCEKCGWGEINKTTGKIPLQIHHVDGNCLNNSEENLQVLCPNCHSLTENYGKLNKNANKERIKYIETRRNYRFPKNL